MWIIYNDSSSRFSAKNNYNALVEPQMSWILQDGPGWRLIFAKNISYAARYRDRAGHETVDLATFARGLPVARFRTSLRLHIGPDFIGWSMPLDATTVSKLSGAEHTQFVTQLDNWPSTRVFPIKEMDAAWRQLLQCAGERG